MKAVYIEQFGGPDVLTYGERPAPEPAEDEVLINVAAASVNAADWKQRRGSYADLEQVAAQRCRILNGDQLKPGTNFHWWPKPDIPA